jgi:hypothetical protein
MIHAGIFLSFFFNPQAEAEADIFLREARWFSTYYTTLYPRGWNFSNVDQFAKQIQNPPLSVSPEYSWKSTNEYSA